MTGVGEACCPTGIHIVLVMPALRRVWSLGGLGCYPCSLCSFADCSVVCGVRV